MKLLQSTGSRCVILKCAWFARPQYAKQRPAQTRDLARVSFSEWWQTSTHRPFYSYSEDTSQIKLILQKTLQHFPLSMRVWYLRLSTNLPILHIRPECSNQWGALMYFTGRFAHLSLHTCNCWSTHCPRSYKRLDLIMLMVLIWRSTIMSGYLCLLPCTIPLNTDISLPRLTGHFQ